MDAAPWTASLILFHLRVPSSHTARKRGGHESGCRALAERELLAVRYGCRALRRSEARDLPAEPPEQVLGVDAELREQARVALGVDLIRELPICLVGLALISSLAQQLEDLFLRYLHVAVLSLG
jgi:hypothetical protein